MLLPYGVAVAKKGAGFYGAGTNAAHNLPLNANPHTDIAAKNHFNKRVKKLFVPLKDIIAARDILNNHHLTNRAHEKNNSIANRIIQKINYPSLTFLKSFKCNTKLVCPMTAIDNTFLAYVKANPYLRPRVGNPDEMISNHMINTLNFLKHRVTEVEKGIAESIFGKVITVLNEEAVVCACLANKAGINLVVTYEAFSPKMLGALRQEINWSNQLSINHREPNWISVPIVIIQSK